MRKYPRTTEDREAIAAARRRYYAQQAAENDLRERGIDLDAAFSTTKQTDDPNGKGDATSTTAGATTTPDPSAGEDKSTVEIPEGFSALEWPELRALAKSLTDGHVVSKKEAIAIIETELARRAAIAAAATGE